MSDDTRYHDGMDDSIRAGDADRERAGDALRAHHTAGRLTAEEFEERIERCMAATTIGELRALLRDLPGERPGRPADRAARRRFGPPLWLLVPLAVAFMLAVAGAGPGWHGGMHGGAWHHHWFPWPLVLLLLGWLAFRGTARAAHRRG